MSRGLERVNALRGGALRCTHQSRYMHRKFLVPLGSSRKPCRILDQDLKAIPFGSIPGLE